uniref:SRS domain-containing protein n=1 Tax=Neospora caninum (strain Liverpool) TaxID=572307 RepID=F0JB55_NEOCL|nr:SRS domain-containing protein [Neospora caninum Liverpool]CEL71322.1 TPA: SRS domain-containing protein [Neospora caninum Liverpool]
MARTRVVLMNWGMMGVVALSVALLMSCSSLGMDTPEGRTAENTCTERTAEEGITVSVDPEQKTASFSCDNTIIHVWPKTNSEVVTTYFVTEQLDRAQSLETVFGEGSKLTVTNQQKKADVNNLVKKNAVLVVGKLPAATTTIYFACATAEQPTERSRRLSADARTLKNGSGVQDASVDANEQATLKKHAQGTNRKDSRGSEQHDGGGSTKKCVVAVTIPADPTAASKSNVYLRSILGISNMELGVTSENKSVSFQCDSIVPVLSPEQASGMVFDESCQNPVKLADMVPSAKLETSSSGYTFIVEELPETAATFCYKCSALPVSDQAKVSHEDSQEKKEACTVKINVAAADLGSDSAAFATAGSVSAPVFGLVTALCVAAVVF